MRLIPGIDPDSHLQGGWQSASERLKSEAEQGAQDVCSSTSAWTPALLCFVNQQLDWTVEAAFGFQPSWTFQDCNGTVSALRC